MNDKIFRYKNNVYVIDENVKRICDEDINYNPNIHNFKVYYNGTKNKWKSIEKEGSILDVPCIKCLDGDYVQKL